MSKADEQLKVRSAMVDNYNAYAEGLDSKNWPLVRSCFCDEVYIDYGFISAPSGDPRVPRRAVCSRHGRVWEGGEPYG